MDESMWIAEASLGAFMRELFAEMGPEDGDFKLVSNEGAEFKVHSLLLCR